MFVLLVGAGPLGSALEELTDQPVNGSEQSPPHSCSALEVATALESHAFCQGLPGLDEVCWGPRSWSFLPAWDSSPRVGPDTLELQFLGFPLSPLSPLSSHRWKPEGSPRPPLIFLAMVLRRK